MFLMSHTTPTTLHRYPIPNPLPANLGANAAGWISWFTLPCSLIASCMLNESFWQRVWASADRRTLHRGAGCGYFLVVLVIFLSGFGGWLALAAGLIDDNTNPNVYLMQVRVCVNHQALFVWVFGCVGGWVPGCVVCCLMCGGCALCHHLSVSVCLSVPCVVIHLYVSAILAAFTA